VIDQSVVPQLPCSVIAPTIEVAIGAESTGVIGTRFECNHAAIKAVYAGRRVSIIHSPNAQLTIAIGAPTDDPAHCRQRADVIGARRNRVDTTGDQAEIDRRLAIHSTAIAQLTMAVLSPTENPSHRGQHTGMTITHRDGVDLTEWKIDIYRDSRIKGRSLVKLAQQIFAPTLNFVAIDERARTVPPRINAHHVRI
jgi:hypothetical protein